MVPFLNFKVFVEIVLNYSRKVTQRKDSCTSELLGEEASVLLRLKTCNNFFSETIIIV